MKRSLLVLALLATPAVADDTVNGKSPQDFYKPFLYHQDDGAQEGQMSFHYAGSADEAHIPGGNQVVSVALHIDVNGSYHGTLSVMHAGGPGEYIHDQDDALSGSWHLDGVNIVLDGLGTGRPSSHNGTAFLLHIDRDGADSFIVPVTGSHSL